MTDADAKLKQGLREKALKDIETWREQRAALIEKEKAKNRLSELNDSDDRNHSGVECNKYVISHPIVIYLSRWERVADLIDFQKTSDKDTSRMKSLLLSLKNAPAQAS